MAVLGGDVDQVQALVNMGVRMSEPHDWILYHACLQGLDMVHALSAAGISFNINVPTDGRDSILHFVLRTPTFRFTDGKFRIVEFLCNHGADPFGRDRLSETALHILAVQLGDSNIELLHYILQDNGSGPVPYLDHQNHYGDTALSAAVLSHNTAAARLLLEFGADPNIKDDLGGNAAHYAIREENIEMVELLYEFGARLPAEYMDVVADDAE